MSPEPARKLARKILDPLVAWRTHEKSRFQPDVDASHPLSFSIFDNPSIPGRTVRPLLQLDRVELKAPKVMSFLATTDLDRAKDFFTNALALPLREEDGWAAMFQNGGTIPRVTRVDTVNPAPYTVLGWEVDDISAIIRILEGRNVKFERFLSLQQDELGVWTAPDGTKVAWFKDPDGNILSFTQFGHKIL